MSGELMGRILANVHGVKPATKIVLIAMANPCRGASSEFFGSLAYLAAHTGIGERQVREHLRELEACGLIVKMNSGKGGPRMTTRYMLNIPLNPANVRRFAEPAKAADVRRVWTPAKAADLENIPAHVVQTTRRTSAAKTLRPGPSNGPSARAPDPAAVPPPAIVQDLFRNFGSRKASTRPKGMTREDQVAFTRDQKQKAANA